LVSFDSRDVFCTLSRRLVEPGFRLFFFFRLAVRYFAVYLGISKFKIEQTSPLQQLFGHFFAVLYKRSQNNNKK